MVQLRHTLLLPIAFFTSLAAASPTMERRQNRGSIRTLSQDEIDAYNPYTYFASAAYCSTDDISSWSCNNCNNADPNFEITAYGGDGSGTPRWYVGYSPSLECAIIAHQGLDEGTTENIANDPNASLNPLNPTIFPRLNSTIKVQSDFQQYYEATASSIISAAKQTLSKTGTNCIAGIGHGIGATISLLDMLAIPENTYDGIRYYSVLYSLPRTGNDIFARYIDQNIRNITHINNAEDIIPTLPSQSLGYSQISGEIHIQNNLYYNEWIACPGRDNDDQRCSTGDLENNEAEPQDYYGPYNNINIGC